MSRLTDRRARPRMWVVSACDDTGVRSVLYRGVHAKPAVALMYIDIGTDGPPGIRVTVNGTHVYPDESEQLTFD